MNKLLIIAVLSATLLSGCAANYRCGGKVPAMSCKNMSQVYRDSGDSFVDFRDEPEKSKRGEKTIVIGQTQNALNAVIVGEPVLTKAQGIRIWIAPWEDKDKDLNYSWVYIRTKESEWTILK